MTRSRFLTMWVLLTFLLTLMLTASVAVAQEVTQEASETPQSAPQVVLVYTTEAGVADQLESAYNGLADRFTAVIAMLGGLVVVLGVSARQLAPIKSVLEVALWFTEQTKWTTKDDTALATQIEKLGWTIERDGDGKLLRLMVTDDAEKPPSDAQEPF